ncbi:hypothetical protein [uncultured Pseudomonas sp.]|uniref:hypothetical protein n=1 Tax=uncultured Pseudomonas sp. TaxID=114707 RepID=UPI0025E06ED3|nr:hypothetical protein [uncultured Pseudomonas sp.]
MNSEALLLIRLQDFKRRYFPVFISGLLLAVFSIALSGATVSATYLLSVPVERFGPWMMLFMSVLVILLSTFYFMIMRGRTCWVWGVVGLSLLCFMIVLPALFFSIQRLFYLVALCVPLSTLFIINTRRHRDMCNELVNLRRQRKQILAARAAQRRSFR